MPRGVGKHLTAEWLRRVYWGEGWSTYRIAKDVGLSPAAVRKRLVQLGIERRSVSEAKRLSRGPIDLTPTPELVWVVAFLCGDGWASVKHRRVECELKESAHNVIRFIEEVLRRRGLNPRLRQTEKPHATRVERQFKGIKLAVHSVTFAEFMERLLANREKLFDFLSAYPKYAIAGFMDAEGTVSWDLYYTGAMISNKDEALLKLFEHIAALDSDCPGTSITQSEGKDPFRNGETSQHFTLRFTGTRDEVLSYLKTLPLIRLKNRVLEGEEVFTGAPRRAKLTGDSVKTIRRLHSEGVTIAELARRYDVSWTTIEGIVKGKSWKHAT